MKVKSLAIRGLAIVVLALCATGSIASSPSAKANPQRYVGWVKLRGGTQTVHITSMTFTYKDAQDVVVPEVHCMTAGPGQTTTARLPRGEYRWPDDVHIEYEKDSQPESPRSIPDEDPPWNDPPWPVRPGYWYKLSPEEIAFLEEYSIYLPAVMKSWTG